MYIVFDIGGTNIKYAVITQKGEIITKDKRPTPDTYEEFINFIKSEISKDKYEGVCFSSPGSVDKLTGEIKGISAIEYIHKHNFAREIKEEFKLNVSIENDANCAALGEVYFTEDKNIDALFLIIGTGIGGAVIYNGKLINGIKNEAGEFGYMRLSKDDSSIILSAQTMPNITKRINKKYNTNYSSYEVFENYLKGENPCYEYVNTAFDYISMAIYNLKYFFDPSILIIGGEISKDNRYIDVLKSRCPYVDIRACKKNNDSNLLGALANYLQKNYIK